MGARKFTKKAREEILEIVRMGGGVERAAREARVSSRMLRYWRAKGREDLAEDKRSAYATFELELSSIIAKHERMMEKSILRAGLSDWRAAAWFLSRKLASEYGEKSTITIQVREQVVEEVLETIRRAVDSETYARVLSALADPSGGETAPRLAH